LTPPNNIVETKQGSLIREKRINEEYTLLEPYIEKIAIQENTAGLSVSLRQKKLINYDAERDYEFILIREESLANWSPHNEIVSVEEHKTRKAAALMAVQNGEKVASYPGGRGMFSSKKNYRGTFIREVTEKKEILTNQVENKIVPAKHIKLKATAHQLGTEIEIQTDSLGLATFSLAKNVQAVRSLRPMRLLISANWKGKWIKLDKLDLTQTIIEKIVDAAKRESMIETGTPSLPPFGHVSGPAPKNCTIAN